MPTLEEKQLAGTPRALFLHPGGDDLAGRMEIVCGGVHQCGRGGQLEG